MGALFGPIVGAPLVGALFGPIVGAPLVGALFGPIVGAPLVGALFDPCQSRIQPTAGTCAGEMAGPPDDLGG